MGHLLRAEGVDCIIVERQTPDYMLGRIRAGVLETVTTDIMTRLGLDQRMKAEGLPHDGFNLADGERLININIGKLTGSHVLVYGQTEITRDLMEAAPERDLEIIYEASDVALHDIDGDSPYLTFVKSGTEHRIDARFIAGCDGFHGPSRKAIPENVGKSCERIYPFGWLGILADVPPCNHELIYANHERSFALASMRSNTRSRYYIDVPLTEKIEDWSDERVWDELAIRLGPEAAANIIRGPSIENSIAPLRSFVFEPMRHGSLLLAGDSAHIVPPTGAKGLNLAVSDVYYLSEALIGFFTQGDQDRIGNYSDKALARVWKSERFSWSLTKLMHRFPDDGPFERAMQIAESLRDLEIAERLDKEQGQEFSVAIEIEMKECKLLVENRLNGKRELFITDLKSKGYDYVAGRLLDTIFKGDRLLLGYHLLNEVDNVKKFEDISDFPMVKHLLENDLSDFTESEKILSDSEGQKGFAATSMLFQGMLCAYDYSDMAKLRDLIVQKIWMEAERKEPSSELQVMGHNVEVISISRDGRLLYTGGIVETFPKSHLEGQI